MGGLMLGLFLNRTILALMGGLIVLSQTALAEPRIDLSPQDMNFTTSITDPNSEQHQLIYVGVLSGGNAPYQNTDPILVKLKNKNFHGTVFAPIFRLSRTGGPIFPGEAGSIAVRVPLRFIQHCENVFVQIDVQKNRQSGPGVFLNDAKVVRAMEIANFTPCE